MNKTLLFKAFYCFRALYHSLVKKSFALVLLILLSPTVAFSQYELLWQVEPFGDNAGPAEVQTESAVDPSGNLLVLAQTDSSEIILYKYAEGGQLLWKLSPRQKGNQRLRFPARLRVDADGNSYVQSYHYEDSSATGVLLTKFSPDGKRLWARTFTSDNYNFKGVGDFIVSTEQEVFIAGHTTKNGKSISIVKRLRENGKTAWSRTTPGTYANSLALTKDGSLVVAGTIPTGFYELPTIHLMKLQHADGQTMLDKNYHVDLKSMDATESMAQRVHVTSAGDIMILASAKAGIYVFNVILLKTDSNGSLKWQQNVGNTDESLLVDAAFNKLDEAVILGREEKYRQTRDYFITKVGTNGHKKWYHTLNTYKGITVNELSPADVDIDADGNIAMTAYGAAFDEPPAFFIPPIYKQEPALVSILYNDAGQQVWENKYAPSTTSRTYGRSINFDAKGNLFVAATRMPAEEPASLVELIIYKFGMLGGCASPVPVKLYLPPHAMAVGEQVRTTADFGNYTQLTDKNLRWDWGDSSTSMAYTTPGSARITGQHRYQETGFYTIGLDFGASCLKPTSNSYKQQLVVYKTEAGTVAGAGEIAHDFVPLAYVQRYQKSSFAFTVRYPDATATRPVGNTLLLLNSRNRFQSTSHDWLVVNGNRAAWQGTGTLDGQVGYKFLITVNDAGAPGLNDPDDRMRIQLWDKYNVLVYDTQGTSTQEKSLTQYLHKVERGQIIIQHATDLLAATKSASMKVEDNSLLEEVLAYPNPFQGMAVVKIAAIHPGGYTAALYDSRGAVVKRLQTQVANTGEQVIFHINGEDLPNGLYIAKIVSPSGAKTVKLILQR
ncbi:T9SS type A sorting domain-containing protein [Pontibacter oryzae]|uniref:T9SS C-terminal target domain-containing protein n=1 Tax=Pontibacter oryzae TaxID=2304593 RepID=A0A399SF74_9BACT|nr:T9SS type A sorting domain-containing protein [Pontibacter oryzae]RIJ41848.1 T9SS C-terminal target domain-containing protein [Pontibacter oryzae]